MGAPRFVLDRFWPSNLFLGGIPGAWYDPTDLSTMFQDSTGTTPVTAVEQPVGLILDKSQGLALGPDLIINGGPFVNTTGWTAIAGATLSVDSGRLKVAQGLTDFVTASQAIATVAGRTYRVTYDLVSDGTSSPSFVVYARQFPGSTNIALSTTGFGTGKTLYFTAVGATTYIEPGSGTSADNIYGLFNNIKVELVAGNHASQSNAASRPTYRARYNLLTQSEDFSQAVWTKTSSTVSANTSVAPDGTTTADTLAEAAAVSFHGANHQSVSVPVGTTLTLSTSFKKGTRRYAQLNFGGSGAVSRWVSCVIDLDTGSITQSSAGAQATLVSAVSSAQGNGWYRVSLTGSVQTDTSIFSYVNMVSTGTPTLGSYGVETYLGVITNNILIWGAQLLTAADVTATGNAYQRIAAATVYDTAPIFRPYLAFDGLDDSLSTSAINFTSTDKMTVFAGETKLQDATAACFCELSANVNTNAGSFTMFSPGNATGTLPGKYLVGLNASTTLFADLSSYPAPDTSVLTVSFNNAGAAAAAQLIPRVDAATPTIAYNAANAGSGNFGNHALFIGRRNNTSFPLNGRIYELIVRGAASSVTEIADTELWVNARTGAY